MTIKNICVFCGASQRTDQEFVDLAAKCGKLIAKKGYNLVFGGGDVGLMGAVSHAAHERGADVSGYYPKIEYLEASEPLNPDLDHTYIVDSMFERKEKMFSQADAFLILPGGVGTLDETFEVITLRYLKEHNKPIIFYNYKGYWEKLFEIIDHMIEHRFAKNKLKDTYEIVNSLEEVFDRIEWYNKNQ